LVLKAMAPLPWYDGRAVARDVIVAGVGVGSVAAVSGGSSISE
jgi:hypothetical protein